MKQVKNHKMFLLIPVLIGLLLIPIKAQELESTTYKIVNPTVNSGGGVATSSGYSLFQSIGSTTGDVAFESENYSFGEGSPSPFQANIPLINCFETTTTGGTTECTTITGSGGMIGQCGEPGCYDRAKLEIDDQNNPIDTLYLVTLSTDSFVSEIFFLQSDHTIASTFDINSYLTQCQLEGIDSDDPQCDDSGDIDWNTTLQEYNVLGLTPNTTYEVAVRALHGDFTETDYSPTLSATTSIPSIGFDIDISSTDTETSAPYSITFGNLSLSTPVSANNSIWIDLSTNNPNGVDVKVESTSSGLYSIANNTYIKSESEDLDQDDGDGGYGARVSSISQSDLGPLNRNFLFFNGGNNSVGALKATPTILVYTENSGANKGQLVSGRSRVELIAKSYAGLPSGTYTDSLFFTAITR